MFYHLDPRGRGERMAQRLEHLPDYRVLRRLPRSDEIWCQSMPVPTKVMKFAVLDVETTGLDPQRCKIIEIAIGTLSVDLDSGEIVDVTAPKSWLEDPAEDLSIEIERLTHITSDMLIGKWFPEAKVMQTLDGCTGIIAHNAKFDRSFAVQRFPAMAQLPWLCSMSEVDWAELGYPGGRSISALLTQSGFFLPDAHRAAADVWATICLLCSPTSIQASIAACLTTQSQRTTYRLDAVRAPFAYKDALKAAGYRWSPERRTWWIEGDPEQIDHEAAWLRQLSGEIKPSITTVTAMNRHA